MQAWNMTNKATENVEKISRDFRGIFETVSNFIVHAYCKLEEVNISVPKSFSISTIRLSRSTPEGITDGKRNFEVSYHNAVTDVVPSSMRARFSSHKKNSISKFPALTQTGFLKSWHLHKTWS